MNLTGTQLQQTYGNVLTIGESAGTPTTGTVQNGAGSDVTSLTVNGTVSANDLSIGDLDVSNVAGSIYAGGGWIDTFNGSAFDTTKWYDNSDTPGEAPVIVNGALRLTNDDSAWDYGIVGKKSFNRADNPVFSYRLKIIDGTAPPAEAPRIMLGVTDTISADSYSDNIHSFYIRRGVTSGTIDVLVYEKTNERGALITDLSEGDVLHLIMRPQVSGGIDYTIYVNNDLSNPYTGTIGSRTEETLYPSIQVNTDTSTIEVYDAYAYDNNSDASIDIKSGGSLGLSSNTGDTLTFSQGGLNIEATSIITENLSATNLTASGEDISELPSTILRWTNGAPSYYAFTNGTKNFIPWNQQNNNTTPGDFFTLHNSAGLGGGSGGARVQIHRAGWYIVSVGIHTLDMNNHNFVYVNLEKTSTLTGTMSTWRTLIADEFNVQHSSTSITMSASRLFYASSADNYWTISMTPSSNSPIMADDYDGSRNSQTYFHLTKISDN